MLTKLRKQPSNWVDGDQFFDREVEIEALGERVRDGTHTLLTAQRRMGKTSLVRELLRRLGGEGQHETLFVDLEGVDTPADAVAEIAFTAREIDSAWGRIRTGFANVPKKCQWPHRGCGGCRCEGTASLRNRHRNLGPPRR